MDRTHVRAIVVGFILVVGLVGFAVPASAQTGVSTDGSTTQQTTDEITITFNDSATDDTVTASTTITISTQSSTDGPGDISGDGNPALDPDGDGLYEDINGDDSVDLRDLRPYFEYVTTDGNAYDAGLDFNEDGELDLRDLRPFFEAIT